MGCILAGISLLIPRVGIILAWIFTDWLSAAYDSALWPVLGWLFMPYTTLAYMGAVVAGGGVEGLWLVLVIVAVAVDVAHWGGGGHYYRRPRRR